MMNQNMYVTMQPFGHEEYEPLAVAVPTEYRTRSYKDIIRYALDTDEGRLAPIGKMMNQWLEQENENAPVIIDVVPEPGCVQSHRLEERVSTNALQRAQGNMGGQTVDYDRLDMRVRRLHTGGTYE